MRVPVILLLSLVALQSMQAQRCPCSRNLDFLIKKVEKNYAGFQDKVNTTTKAGYREFTDQFIAKALSIKDDSTCARHCIQWTKWFKDRHLGIHPIGSGKMLWDIPAFSLAAIDSQTMLLVLPSMSGTYKTLVDSMIRAHASELQKKPFLIIDCRNNGGGDDYTWAPLKPYLYTQPTQMDGFLYWASEDNAQFMLESLENRHASKQERKYVKAKTAEMKKHPGTLIGTMNAYRERNGTPLPNPQKVAILLNNHSASSTENFALWARQSKKVVLMGRQTAGVVDYGGANIIPFPCRDWELWVPMLRSNRVADGRALDNIGIAPSIPLDENDPDWILRAKEYLQTQK